MVFCYECRDDVDYYTKVEIEKVRTRTGMVEVPMIEPHCSVCGGYLHVPELQDENLKKYRQAVRGDMNDIKFWRKLNDIQFVLDEVNRLVYQLRMGDESVLPEMGRLGDTMKFYIEQFISEVNDEL